MDTITYQGIFFLVILVIPVLIINQKLGIALNKRIIISIIRMLVQLSLVGLYLQYIFDLNMPVLNVLYLVLMMFVATVSVSHSTNLSFKKLSLPLFISMLLPNLLMVLFFNKFVIHLDEIFDARYIITIGGMLLGNVLNGDIVGLNAFYKGIADNKERFNYDLALGASRYQAYKPYLKDAITASIKPTVASMATIGLVSLPGMMTGQILGGSVPLEAIMYQIAIMIAIFVVRYFNIIMAILLTQKMMFDHHDQIIY